MAKLSILAFTASTIVLIAFAAACGGKGPAPANDQVNDPASVPSSTPLANAPVYYIVGDTITMKGGATATIGAGNSTPSSGSSQSYTVVAGDTCYGIASQFGITIDQLYRANGGENGACASLSAGNVMHIPGQAPTTTPTPGNSAVGGNNNSKTATPSGTGNKTYTVQAGDTCYGIATSLGVDPDQFVAANSSACNNLQEGDTLNVP